MDGRKTIVVVDDIPANLTMVKKALAGVYRVFPVPSSAKLFELLEHVRPDIILLDVLMPEINGYEAAKMLKSNDDYKDIPIIFLTGVIDVYNEIEGFAIGAVDYIHKPFEKELLLKRIKTHLSYLEHQEQLIREKENAQNSARAEREFLSAMSHEIRTPLNAIIGMLTIAKNSDDQDKISECINKAENASNLLMSIINDVLDMSKIEANKLEIAVTDFNMGKMVEEITNVVNIRAEAKNQVFNVIIDDDVPLYIQSDELRLSQVIVNLLTNAVKFTPDEGTITLRIRLFEESGEDITLLIEVQDTGIGISKEQQKRLFSSYVQADEHVARKYGGSGLGLTISKKIVEMLGGDIFIDSDSGRGSKFMFTVKAKKGSKEIDESKIQDSLSPREEKQISLEDYSILIAEDVDINREIVQTYLEPTGLELDFAENGMEAVHLYCTNPGKYAMIFMDVQMPEMDGYEATRQIRAYKSDNAKSIPIIAMTANVFKEDVEKSVDAGMNAHIGKPIDANNMLELIRFFI